MEGYSLELRFEKEDLIILFGKNFHEMKGFQIKFSICLDDGLGSMLYKFAEDLPEEIQKLINLLEEKYYHGNYDMDQLLLLEYSMDSLKKLIS